jgi:hypothetical protein
MCEERDTINYNSFHFCSSFRKLSSLSSEFSVYTVQWLYLKFSLRRDVRSGPAALLDYSLVDMQNSFHGGEASIA